MSTVRVYKTFLDKITIKMATTIQCLVGVIDVYVYI